MTVVYVRDARPADAGEIARTQLTTWRIACRPLLPGPALDDLDEAWLAARWRIAVEAPPSRRHRVLVAVERAGRSGPEQLVGFAAAGPADDQSTAPGEPLPPPDRTVAVTELLVEPRWGRRGHGSRLLAACADLWRQDGFSTAVAWVYQGDHATERFLSSAGWQPDGAQRALEVDARLVPQLRMHTRLG